MSNIKNLSLSLKYITEKIRDYLKTKNYNCSKFNITKKMPIIFKTTTPDFDKEITITLYLRTFDFNFLIQPSVEYTKEMKKLLIKDMYKIFSSDCDPYFKELYLYKNLLNKENESNKLKQKQKPKKKFNFK